MTHPEPDEAPSTEQQDPQQDTSAGSVFDDDTTTSTSDEGSSQQPESEQPLTRDEITKLVADAGQRIADRQVNALMREVRGGKGKRSSQQHNTDEQQKPSQEQHEQERHDAREARMAFREYLNDGLRFVDASERELATTLGAAATGSQLAEHGDPDRAGKVAAEHVTSQIKTYRQAIERQVMAKLRQRGVLVAEPGRGVESQAGAPAPEPSELGDKRAAAQQLAAQFNQEIGHPASAAGA